MDRPAPAQISPAIASSPRRHPRSDEEHANHYLDEQADPAARGASEIERRSEAFWVMQLPVSLTNWRHHGRRVNSRLMRAACQSA